MTWNRPLSYREMGFKLLSLGAVALAFAEEEVAGPYTPPAAIEGASFFEPFLVGWESRWLVSKDADFPVQT